MVETEIWPNVIRALAREGSRIVIVNGRISDRSYGQYNLVKGLLKETFGRIDLFCMRSEADADKVVSLGAPRAKVTVTGTMKFDQLPKAVAGRLDGIRALLDLKEGDDLIVAGSTHPGEEGTLLDVFKRLLEDLPRTRLLIAPRHVARAADIVSLAGKYGFRAVRMSQLGASPGGSTGDAEVVILDSIGQLADIYCLAAVVFVGGSLVRHGGQNPIEPAMAKRAILFGPYMHNFRDTADAFLEKGAVRQVTGERDLLDEISSLLRDKEARGLLGERAYQVVVENAGATARTIEAMRRVI
jgi:3-deoxy-D-manno-octulosonic-acid transferase